MPGTDVGSAPQESWHGQTLKPAFLKHRYEPFDLAENLEAAIVNPQLQTLQEMAHQGASYEDWPAIGQFISQHILRNGTALVKDGRTQPKTLLGLNIHQIFQDDHGSTWMLVPKSTLKVDWSISGKKSLQGQKLSGTASPCSESIRPHGPSKVQRGDQAGLGNTATAQRRRGGLEGGG